IHTLFQYLQTLKKLLAKVQQNLWNIQLKLIFSDCNDGQLLHCPQELGPYIVSIFTNIELKPSSKELLKVDEHLAKSMGYSNFN
ncbi:29243_t:CDS:1, partial [Gigaspora margarita]